MDDYAKSGKKRFCNLFKLSERSNCLVIPKSMQQPDKTSPSKPFFDDPSLNVDTVLKTVFRMKGKLSSSATKSRVCTGWMASPSHGDNVALAFTAGHCFTPETFSLTYAEDSALDLGDKKFSELLGCFGSDVALPEFDRFGFECATTPMALVNGEEDFALVQITDRVEKMEHFLLPCSATLECNDNKKFMALFSYPCTQSLLMQAYKELIEGRKAYGIEELYSFLGLDKVALYNLLSETFVAFTNGSLVCSPGALGFVDGVHCRYKCSTVKGSSGAPVVPTHLQGYTIGIHVGTKPKQDMNKATSTDSKGFVGVYSRYVLPRLPPRHSKFWAGWNLAPFERWLNLHHLEWKQVDSNSGFKHWIQHTSCAFCPGWFSLTRMRQAAYSVRLSWLKQAIHPISQHRESKLKCESSHPSKDEVAMKPLPTSK